MSIELLKKLLPPPNKPLHNSVDWDAVATKYGITVPSDYKELIYNYGSGAIDGFLWLLNPETPNTNINFEKSEYFITAYETMKDDFPHDFPRLRFPEQKSFFPWAVTDNGETLVWIVDGNPDEWKVAIHSVDQGEEELYDMNAITFLSSLLERKIKTFLLPSKFPSQNPTYTPGG